MSKPDPPTKKPILLSCTTPTESVTPAWDPKLLAPIHAKTAVREALAVSLTSGYSYAKPPSFVPANALTEEDKRKVEKLRRKHGI